MTFAKIAPEPASTYALRCERQRCSQRRGSRCPAPPALTMQRPDSGLTPSDTKTCDFAIGLGTAAVGFLIGRLFHTT